MKKFLLVVALAATTLAASAIHSAKQTPVSVTIENKLNKVKAHALTLAEDKPMPAAEVITPKGDSAWYTMNAYVSTMFGIYYAEGLADKVYIDGKDLYTDLFPASGAGFISKGVVSEDGTTVTFSKDEVVGQMYGYDLHVVEYVFDDPDADLPSAYIDVVFKKDGDHIYIDDDVDEPTRYISLEAFDGNKAMGYVSISLCIDLNKLEADYKLVEIPAAATKKPYVYFYSDDYGDKYADLGNVYFDGNDVYFDKAAGLDAVVKGTIEGNKVTIENGQFLGASTYFLFSGAVKTDWEYDEDYNVDIDTLDSFVLDYDAATGTFSLTDTLIWQSAITDMGSLYSVAGRMKIEAYAGDKPAIPADPTNVTLSDYTEDYGQYCLSASAVNFDVDGKFINPAGIEIAVVEDGDYLTLTAEDGYDLDEDVVWMPWGFLDLNGGYDLSYSNGSASFYLYESLFGHLGLQLRYTTQGVTKYSNIVYADDFDEVIVVEVDHSTGVPLEDAISTVKVKNAKTIYNLYGMKMAKAQKGLNIVNGKVTFVAGSAK